MSNIDEILNIEFDLISCLRLISDDESLLTLFEHKYGGGINSAISHAKSGDLDDKYIEYIRSIFHEVILKREGYVNEYKQLSNNKQEKDVKPRRYGKQKILEDINKNNGESSEIQKMLLEVNDLKNIVARLNRRGRKQIISGEEVLTKKQCREVVGVIHTIKNKLNKEGIL